METASEARYRVLLVSDDRLETETVRRTLQSHDISADLAADEGAAVAMSAEAGYDAILVDYGRTSPEIIASLRKRHVDAPVLMIVKGEQSAMAAHAIKGVLYGALDYIPREPGYLDRLPELIESNAGKFTASRLKGELQEEVDRLAYAVAGIDECVVLTDRWGNVLYTNAAFNAKYGYVDGELAGADVTIAFEGRVIADVMRDLKGSHGDGGWSGELDTVSKAGAPMRSLVTLTARRNPKGAVRSYMLLIRDITEMKRCEEGLRRKLTALTGPGDDLSSLNVDELFDRDGLQGLQDALSDAMEVSSIIVRLDGEPLTVENNFSRLCTYVRTGTENGRDFCRLCHREIAEAAASGTNALRTCQCTGLAVAGVPLAIEGRPVACWILGQVALREIETAKVAAFIKGLGGDEARVAGLVRSVPTMTERRFSNLIRAVHSVAGQLSVLAAQNLQQARFIAERDRAMEELRLSEERFRHMSMHDALTGLHNRAHFQQEVARLDGTDDEVSIVAIDVDDLKVVNDTLGHTVGDELLVALARVLHETFGEGVVSRVGGDEFCAILKGEGAEAAEVRRIQLLENVAARNRTHSQPLISVSVGVATRRPGESLFRACQRADGAMYSYKQGRGGFRGP